MGYTAPFNAAGTDGPQRGRAIRVLVVDDSVTVRAVFSRVVGSEADLELAAALPNAEEALDFLVSERVDVILLDLEMPGMGGFGAMPKMLERAREAKIMVVSSLTADGAEQTVEALRLGAADTLQKPQSGGFTPEYREKLLDKIRALGRRPLRRQTQDGAAGTPALALRSASRDKALVLAIGASTGGIHSLSQLFVALPEQIGVPILVTQHLPASFIDAFAQQLADVAQRETAIAENGTELLPDRIILAPGDAHMTVDAKGERIKLDRGPVPTGCMPSVDPMLASIGQAFGRHALGVVLTGMGRDGTTGAHELVMEGGTVLVQNEASSAVWGMPGSIARAGYAAAILHPYDLAARIAAATGRP